MFPPRLRLQIYLSEKTLRRSILSEYVMLKSAIGANKSGDILLVGALSSIIVRHCDGRYNSKTEQRRRRRRTKAAFGDREGER